MCPESVSCKIVGMTIPILLQKLDLQKFTVLASEQGNTDTSDATSPKCDGTTILLQAKNLPVTLLTPHAQARQHIKSSWFYLGCLGLQGVGVAMSKKAAGPVDACVVTPNFATGPRDAWPIPNP